MPFYTECGTPPGSGNAENRTRAAGDTGGYPRYRRTSRGAGCLLNSYSHICVPGGGTVNARSHSLYINRMVGEPLSTMVMTQFHRFVVTAEMVTFILGLLLITFRLTSKR